MDLQTDGPEFVRIPVQLDFSSSKSYKINFTVIALSMMYRFNIVLIICRNRHPRRGHKGTQFKKLSIISNILITCQFFYEIGHLLNYPRRAFSHPFARLRFLSTKIRSLGCHVILGSCDDLIRLVTVS